MKMQGRVVMMSAEILEEKTVGDEMFEEDVGEEDSKKVEECLLLWPMLLWWTDGRATSG